MATGTGGKLIGSRRIVSQETAQLMTRVHAVETHALHNDVEWGLGLRRFAFVPLGACLMC